ncbi:MAG TPA: tetratricopeptide repeat protein, partial [Anaerolineaceae bacterium]
MNRRRRKIHPFRLAILAVLIGAAVYVNQVVVPQTPPLFLATPTATRDPSSYIAEGQAAFNDGKIAKAISAYQLAVQSNGATPSTFITLAQLELYNHQYKDALSDIGNALLLSPNNSTALALKGYAQYSLEDYSGAEASLKSAMDS